MRANANVAASQTDSVLVAAQGTNRIRVYALALMTGNVATNVTLNSKPAGAGTPIGPLWAAGANGGLVLPHSPDGWFDTAAGEGLSVSTGAGSATGIALTYDYVPANARD